MSFGDIDREKFEVALRTVSSWDFALAKEKLLEPAYAGWTIDRANAAERDYKRYMAITAALGGNQLVPNGDIDRFWHEHILDTRRYAKDCFELFGGFLHHYPYFGMRGDEDNQNWIEAAQASNDLWSREFGEELYTSPHQEIAGPNPMKCPQACPNPGVEVAAAPKKCPQACPNPGVEVAAAPMKCPQACPNPGVEFTPQQSPFPPTIQPPDALEALAKKICPSGIKAGNRLNMGGWPPPSGVLMLCEHAGSRREWPWPRMRACRSICRSFRASCF